MLAYCSDFDYIRMDMSEQHANKLCRIVHPRRSHVISVQRSMNEKYSLTKGTLAHRRTGRGGGQLPPPNSGSLSTLILAESRDYSGKTQYMFE